MSVQWNSEQPAGRAHNGKAHCPYGVLGELRGRSQLRWWPAVASNVLVGGDGPKVVRSGGRGAGLIAIEGAWCCEELDERQFNIGAAAVVMVVVDCGCGPFLLVTTALAAGRGHLDDLTVVIVASAEANDNPVLMAAEDGLDQNTCKDEAGDEVLHGRNDASNRIGNPGTSMYTRW